MPEFPEFPHRPTLLIDASGPITCVAIFNNRALRGQRCKEIEALDGIFSLTRKCLLESNLCIRDITTFIYGEGPGSTLGLRLSAMAIRTWQTLLQREQTTQCFAFSSLKLSAVCLQERDPGRFDHILCPWKKNEFFSLNLREDISSSHVSSIDREALKKSNSKFAFVQIGRATVSPLPGEQTFASPAEKFPTQLLKHTELMNEVKLPQPFAFEAPAFQTWHPERHRG